MPFQTLGETQVYFTVGIGNSRMDGSELPALVSNMIMFGHVCLLKHFLRLQGIPYCTVIEIIATYVVKAHMTHIVPFGKFHRIRGAQPKTFPNVKYDSPEEVGGNRKCFDSPIGK